MPQVTQFLRIRPGDKQRKGYRVARYHILGRLFEETHGWYRCSYSVEQWEYLRNARQSQFDPDAGPVFDIATASEKAAIDAREKKSPVELSQEATS